MSLSFYGYRCYNQLNDQQAAGDLMAKKMKRTALLSTLITAIPFGALPVFVITSTLAACFDAMFVLMQRYNRPRIMKLLEKAERSKLKNC